MLLVLEEVAVVELERSVRYVCSSNCAVMVLVVVVVVAVLVVVVIVVVVAVLGSRSEGIGR